MAIMYATVNDIIAREGLLVTDSVTGQEVMVHFRDTNRFTVGDTVRISFTGQMTFSIPPQITATSIEIVRPRPTPAPEIWAVVLQRRPGVLIVRDLRNGRQIRVNYSHADHFCVGQRILIRHEAIRFTNPVEVNAVNITPIC